MLHKVISEMKKESDELRSRVETAVTVQSIITDMSSSADAKGTQVTLEVELAKLSSENRDLKDEKERVENELNSLKDQIFTMEKERLQNEIEVSEAKQRNALFLEWDEEWKKKEADYVENIKQLQIANAKPEGEKIEELRNEVAFLNSIIATQQKKQKEMQEHIDILTNIPALETLVFDCFAYKAFLSELSDARPSTPLCPAQVCLLHARCGCAVLNKLHVPKRLLVTAANPPQFCTKKVQRSSANNVETLSVLSSLATSGDGARQTRPFCDICEQFDLHDTTECPTQEMETVEYERHSHYGRDKKKTISRPYCENCEGIAVFF
uniref:CLIP1 zinc knuckle domain-containing protein n=1 Tax=Parascaris equorum TaxID=6256 RepID=A0A914R5R1_PAREQ